MGTCGMIMRHAIFAGREGYVVMVGIEDREWEDPRTDVDQNMLCFGGGRQ